MKVCLVPQELGAPAAYRLFFPFRELQERAGWRVVLPPIKDGRVVVDEGRLPAADVYVLHHANHPLWASWIQQLRGRGKIVVADTDDLYGQLPAYHPAARWLREGYTTGTIRDEDGNAAFRAKRRRPESVETLLSTYPLVDVLTVSTPHLAKFYRRKAGRVAHLPNYLDWGMWQNATLQHEVTRRRGRVRVGWQGAAIFRRGDLQPLKRWLRPWLEQHPHVDFVAAGDPAVHDILDVPHAQRLSFPRVDFNEPGALAKVTASMDIGLVPLQPNPFNEAKSALKGMEYAACGIPCVASPTGEYRRFVKPGVTGVLADGPKEWVAALDVLVEDDGLRRRMGAAARAKAATLTIQQHWEEWRDLYEHLAAGRARDVADGSDRLDRGDGEGRDPEASGALGRLGIRVPA